MKLEWHRQNVVRMTARVEELAALLAGARLAAGALEVQAGESASDLRRVIGDLDRAVRALSRTKRTAGKAAQPWDGLPTAAAAASGNDALYHEGSRSLQDRFGTRRLADRVQEIHVHDRITDHDRAFIERMDTFFVATADEEGRPNCSHKGGDPGFVRVVDDHTIAFPNYDGNGMYLSTGNVLRNPNVGLLFVDFDRAHRMRLNGVASIAFDDELLSEYPEAQFIVRVRAREVFPNCPRYIHRRRLVERSRFVPRSGSSTPVPDWKREAWAREALPVRDGVEGSDDHGVGACEKPGEGPSEATTEHDGTKEKR
jgi:hypothetical protein